MNEQNTWPGGRRHAMSQADHEAWNSRNYPGTRQLCSECGQPTGRCEEDSMYTEMGPVCEGCWQRDQERSLCQHIDDLEKQLREARAEIYDLHTTFFETACDCDTCTAHREAQAGKERNKCS